MEYAKCVRKHFRGKILEKRFAVSEKICNFAVENKTA